VDPGVEVCLQVLQTGARHPRRHAVGLEDGRQDFSRVGQAQGAASFRGRGPENVVQSQLCNVHRKFGGDAKEPERSFRRGHRLRPSATTDQGEKGRQQAEEVGRKRLLWRTVCHCIESLSDWIETEASIDERSCLIIV